MQLTRAGAVAALVAMAALVNLPRPAAAQEAPAATSRTGALEQAKAAKSTALVEYTPGRVEAAIDRAEDLLLTGRVHVHPFFTSAYSGGGFTLGAGYITYVGSYNTLDTRGSITFTGYKRIESEFIAPRLFNRRGRLSLLGGWREATQVGFYGIGTANTSSDGRANYKFTQPYADATLVVRPTRRYLVLVGGLEGSQWTQEGGGGSAPSVEERYTPDTLPGLGASPTYLHSRAAVAFDSRPGAGYARRGGYYGVTVHDFHDTDESFGFNQVDYEAIQHIPLLRETWVLSLHGLVQTANAKSGETIPFFMLPALGGGSSLRGYASWRFRDRNSLLLQAEWRVMVNRFFDTALFFDAGKVTDKRSDLDLRHLKDDYGIGFRLHGPLATPLRVELAKGNEGLSLVFAASAAF